MTVKRTFTSQDWQSCRLLPQRETMHKAQQESMAARNAALADLYAVLTPEQKAVADQRLQGRRGHRMAGHTPGK